MINPQEYKQVIISTNIAGNEPNSFLTIEEYSESPFFLAALINPDNVQYVAIPPNIKVTPNHTKPNWIIFLVNVYSHEPACTLFNVEGDSGFNRKGPKTSNKLYHLRYKVLYVYHI